MGKNEELALVLDYQSELSIQAPSEQEEDQNYKKVRNLNFNTVENLNTEAAKVHIDTLSSFKGFGGGIYQLTDVKRMTAKKDFLKMPLEERKCEVELYESCRTRRLMQKCNCVPWEMQEFQVLVTYRIKILLLKDLEKCSPRGRDCIEKNFAQTFNCNVTCEGIYADVQLVNGEEPKEMMRDKNPEQLLDKMDLLRLIFEYQEFKRTRVQHFRFNSEANTTMFGNLMFFISIISKMLIIRRRA